MSEKSLSNLKIKKYINLIYHLITLKMVNTLITLSAKSTNFTTKFNPPVKLNGVEHEIALTSLETYHSFPNINEKNNVFKYSSDNGATWKNIEIPKGSYGLLGIYNEILRGFRENGDYDEINETYPIILLGNKNTAQIVMEISANYIVNFRTPNSINTVLGFNSKNYNEGYHKSENVINILPVNSILVHVDNVIGSYMLGKASSVLYSFFPNVAPGVKIIERPYERLYLPIITQDIHEIRLRLTDQKGEILDLRGEEVTVSLHLTEKKK